MIFIGFEWSISQSQTDFSLGAIFWAEQCWDTAETMLRLLKMWLNLLIMCFWGRLLHSISLLPRWTIMIKFLCKNFNFVEHHLQLSNAELILNPFKTELFQSCWNTLCFKRLEVSEKIGLGSLAHFMVDMKQGKLKF